MSQIKVVNNVLPVDFNKDINHPNAMFHIFCNNYSFIFTECVAAYWKGGSTELDLKLLTNDYIV